MFWNVAILRHQHQVDPTPLAVKRGPKYYSIPFDLESGVQVTCDVSYLCANFGLPRPHFSRLRPDICDRQTDRQTSD